MHSISPMHETHVVLRWTPAWVILISIMTPVSAWMLHTVNTEAVPWYLGIMAWLTLTPDRRPKWLMARQIVVASSESAQSTPTNDSLIQATDGLDANSFATSQSQEPATSEKKKKTRARARKPKAVTLAEMKSLTSGADRAVVWSQVGPGKFVRQANEENDSEDSENPDSQQDSADANEPVMISPNIGNHETVIEMDTEETYED